MSEFHPGPNLPEVDERLVAPGTRYEIEDGRVVYVPPADEPHGETHARLASILRAHKGDAFSVAVDMLTRTSRIDDIAPDVSVYPTARHPRTGGRQLEQLAFEVASTESLGHAGARAAKLVARGVRRVFAIDVEHERVLEWSAALDAWSILDLSAAIVDNALATPIPTGALVDAARADEVVVRAFRTRRHAEFLAEREEGRSEGAAVALLAALTSRGLRATTAERERMLAERDLARILRWMSAVSTTTSIAALLAIA